MLPVERRAAAHAKRRHDIAELRMHWSAVVALVVVLGDHLPVGGHVIGDRPADDELVEREALDSIGDRPELVGQCRAVDSEPDEDETAPFVNGETMQGEVGGVDVVDPRRGS